MTPVSNFQCLCFCTDYSCVFYCLLFVFNYYFLVAFLGSFQTEIIIFLTNFILSEGAAHFMQFLASEYCSENYEFWKEIKQLKEDNPSGDKLKKKVKNIYDKYIGESASKQVRPTFNLLSHFQSSSSIALHQLFHVHD